MAQQAGGFTCMSIILPKCVVLFQEMQVDKQARYVKLLQSRRADSIMIQLLQSARLHLVLGRDRGDF